VDSAEELAGRLAGGQATGRRLRPAPPPRKTWWPAVVERLRRLGQGEVLELQGVEEDVNFPLPRELA